MFFFLTPSRKQDRSFARWAVCRLRDKDTLEAPLLWGAQRANGILVHRYKVPEKEPTEWRCDGAAKAYLGRGGLLE